MPARKILINELHISAFASAKLTRQDMDLAYRLLNGRRFRLELLRAVQTVCRRHRPLRQIDLKISG